MPIRISKALKIPQKALRNKGVYDGLLDYDSPLHIDPALISTAAVKEFKNAGQTVIDFFTDILRLIKQTAKEGDVFWDRAQKMIATGEGINTPLGFSKTGTGGSGIGPKVACEIIKTIKDIQNAGVNDPTIFELVSIFQGNIGPDRISDWISHILQAEFAEYTQRITNELKIKKTVKVIFNSIEYILPANPLSKNRNDKYIMFLPTSLLSDIPIVEKWDDVPIAKQYNENVRQSLNNLIGDSWKAASSIKKDLLKDIFKKQPNVLKDLIKLYKKRQRNSYDFINDRLGDLVWDEIGYSFSNQESLNLENYSPTKPEDVMEIAIKICNQFKNLIENNGLANHLYDSNGKRRPERFSQLLLFAVADSYCDANNLDLTREPNAGSGALDFKFSNGLAKTNVEVKYSSNGKLVEGYKNQITTYNIAEKVENKHSIYLVIKTSETGDNKIEEIENLIAEYKRLKQSYVKLIVINGIVQPSASNR